MTSEVHEFEAREGGAVRISLTYDAPDRAGKTSGRTDTYRGRFVRLVPNELVVEADEFESDDPAMRGEMMTTITLSDADGGTELVAVHDRLPEGDLARRQRARLARGARAARRAGRIALTDEIAVQTIASQRGTVLG